MINNTASGWNSMDCNGHLPGVSLRTMTRRLAPIIFLAVLCACSKQREPVTVVFASRPGPPPDPQKFLEESKRICEAVGREFTLLEPPPHWRFSCEPHGAKSAADTVK